MTPNINLEKIMKKKMDNKKIEHINQFVPVYENEMDNIIFEYATSFGDTDATGKLRHLVLESMDLNEISVEPLGVMYNALKTNNIIPTLTLLKDILTLEREFISRYSTGFEGDQLYRVFHTVMMFVDKYLDTCGCIEPCVSMLNIEYENIDGLKNEHNSTILIEYKTTLKKAVDILLKNIEKQNSFKKYEGIEPVNAVREGLTEMACTQDVPWNIIADNCYDVKKYNAKVKKELLDKIGLKYLKLADTRVEPTMEQFIDFLNDCNTYTVMERKGATARKVTDKIKKGARDIEQKTKGNKTKAMINKSASSIDNLVNNSMDKIRDMNAEEKRRKIVEGGFRFNLLKLIRKAILVAGTAHIGGPVFAAISLITSSALSKKTEAREKKRILHELETELKIVEEKIEDARGEQDRNKKYELIRLKNTLEKDVTRIRYNLKPY